jgi:hypothetical protein
MAPKVESISSEDGAYCIQLGEAIQVQTKHAGTKVGVYNGRLLKSPQPVDIEAEAAKKLGHLGSYLCQDTNEVCCACTRLRQTQSVDVLPCRIGRSRFARMVVIPGHTTS